MKYRVYKRPCATPDCPVILLGTVQAQYCPGCRAERKRARDREYQRRRKVRRVAKSDA